VSRNSFCKKHPNESKGREKLSKLPGRYGISLKYPLAMPFPVTIYSFRPQSRRDILFGEKREWEHVPANQQLVAMSCIGSDSMTGMKVATQSIRSGQTIRADFLEGLQLGFWL
jgi:hypothetical protein